VILALFAAGGLDVTPSSSISSAAIVDDDEVILNIV
jgi:hypothetical protein